jgi:23S rRNA pseudouridine1911/1915/1917 synthase
MIVPAALEGERVDRAVALLTGWTRAAIQGLLADGSIRVDGNIAAKSHRLRGGAIIELLAEPGAELPPVGDATIDVMVRYADDDIVVVAKPAGLVVHPGAGHTAGTLVNGLLARYPELSAVGDPMRPGIVHRLDRDTSGLIMVARSSRAYDALVAALAARVVERRYVALVWGRPAASRGLIDAPIGRSESRRTRMAVREAGKPARTEYDTRTAYHIPVCTLLECRLETGRTHQVRVHLAAIGHPVVGDATYGGARDQLPLDRPFLHAATLGFPHPGTGERVRFEEPLPPDLEELLSRLERDDEPPA